MKRYVWRDFMVDQYPTLIQIGELYTGARLTNVFFAKDNTNVLIDLNFNTYSTEELESMQFGEMRVVMEFGEFPFEVVGIETVSSTENFKDGANVRVSVRVYNSARFLSKFCQRILKRFMV
ncbi:MAG: hypothetical protein WC052_06130 [Patescibacteria group bacterium]